MNKTYLLVLLLLIISCVSRKENKQVLEKMPAEHNNDGFERLTFSVSPGWSRDGSSKDVEIRKDGIVYYRQRDDRNVTVNYKSNVDSMSLSKIYALLDSINFNSLKYKSYEIEDGPYSSLKFVFTNGEVAIRGSLQDELQGKVSRLLKIIESQNLIRSENRHFSTAKDVLVPPPPGTEDLPESLDSL